MAFDLSGDWSVWDGEDEPATLVSVSANSDTEVAVATALRLPVREREKVPSYGVYIGADNLWCLPRQFLDGVVPKPRDRIKDGEDIEATVLEVAYSTATQIYDCTCRILSLAYDLRDTVTIEIPTIGQGATGSIQKTWTRKYQDIPCRLQPDETVDFKERGKHATRVKYSIYVDRQLDPRNADGDWGRVLVKGQYAEIEDYKNAELIGDLSLITAMLDP